MLHKEVLSCILKIQMSLRHKARSAAIQVLCSLLWRNTVLTDDVQKSMKEVKEEFFPQERENDFFESLIFGCIKNRSTAAPIIQKYAPKFTLDQLAAVDRTVLEMGLYELMHTQTPTAIVINEAVELAKEFGDDGTPKFVNGVLSSYIKDVEKNAESS